MKSPQQSRCDPGTLAAAPARHFSRPSSAPWASPLVAEDLGLITPDVIELRDGCGRPGMRILQFVFRRRRYATSSAAQLCAQYGRLFRDHTTTITARGWWDHAIRASAPSRRYLAAGAHDIHGDDSPACIPVANRPWSVAGRAGAGWQSRMNLSRQPATGMGWPVRVEHGRSEAAAGYWA